MHHIIAAVASTSRISRPLYLGNRMQRLVLLIRPKNCSRDNARNILFKVLQLGCSTCLVDNHHLPVCFARPKPYFGVECLGSPIDRAYIAELEQSG